eukprot:jgi/Chlat1/3729/Chrsp259S03939
MRVPLDARLVGGAAPSAGLSLLLTLVCFFIHRPRKKPDGTLHPLCDCEDRSKNNGGSWVQVHL